MDNLNSKKFILSVLLVVISAVFVVLNKLDSTAWMAFVGSVTAAYLGVNLTSQYMSKSDSKVTQTITPQV